MSGWPTDEEMLCGLAVISTIALVCCANYLGHIAEALEALAR